MIEDTDIGKDEKSTQLVQIATETKVKALTLAVHTPREYEQVSEFLSQIKGKQKEIDGHRVHLKEPFLLGCRRIDEFFRAPLQFLREAEAEAKKKLLGYESEQKRIAAEEQRKLEEKARKEREALETKARTEREEADRKAAELRRQAEEARASNDKATAALLASQANKIEEKSEARAIAAETKAAQIVAPKVEAYIPPVVGQSSRTIWKSRVLDAKAVPDEYKIVDVAMLNKFAQATKGKIAVPGVEFYPEEVLAARSR